MVDPSKMEEKIKQIVAEADRDNSGTLDVEEFVTWYESIYTAELGREAKRHFAKLDKDGSGSLDRDELRSFVEEVVIAVLPVYATCLVSNSPLHSLRTSTPCFEDWIRSRAGKRSTKRSSRLSRKQTAITADRWTLTSL